MRASWLLVGLVVACSPYDPDLPSAPFLCGPQSPPCPDGFTCTPQGGQNVCLDDSGSDDGGGFHCAANGVFQGTTSISTAFQTPVASVRPSITYGPLSICPAGEKNTFAVDITNASATLSASVTYEPNGDPLTLLLLDATGSADATGSPAGQDTVSATFAEPAAGTVYVQVTGPATPGAFGGENNYNVTIAVNGP
jgi:hypothetical protein